MHVDPRGRVKDIASASEAAERVLESCGVDFCCKGDSTLREACAQAGVNEHEVERRLRELPDATGERWDDVGDLVDVILGVGHERTRHAVAEVRAAAPRGRHAELDRALDELFALSGEQMHLEQSLFHHVRALARARAGRGPFPAPPFSTMHVHGKRLHEGHKRIHQKLRRVHTLASAPGVDSPAIRRAVDALTHAMVRHMHLVNNELLPRARALEPE